MKKSLLFFILLLFCYFSCFIDALRIGILWSSSSSFLHSPLGSALRALTPQTAHHQSSSSTPFEAPLPPISLSDFKSSLLSCTHDPSSNRFSLQFADSSSASFEPIHGLSPPLFASFDAILVNLDASEALATRKIELSDLLSSNSPTSGPHLIAFSTLPPPASPLSEYIFSTPLHQKFDSSLMLSLIHISEPTRPEPI